MGRAGLEHEFWRARIKERCEARGYTVIDEYPLGNGKRVDLMARRKQRVVLIEQLRKGQTGPVHMLDQISRALPSMLWLTEVKQTGTDIVIDGRCTSPIGVSDFVANLEASGYFKRSIEIVSTTSEPMPQPPGELIKFSIRAVFQQPGDAKPTAAPAAAGATH